MANDPLRVKIVGDTTDIERAIARVEQRLDRLAVTAGRVKTELAGALSPAAGGAPAAGPTGHAATQAPAALGAVNSAVKAMATIVAARQPGAAATPAAGTATAAVRPPAPPHAPAPPATAKIPAAMLGATGMSALQMRTMARSDIDDRTIAARQEHAQALAKTVNARKALAAAELAEVQAATRARATRSTPATGSNNQRARAEADAAEEAAAKARTVAARRAVAEASPRSAATRQRLTAAEGVQAYAARTTPKIPVATAAAEPEVTSRRAALAGRLKGAGRSAAIGGAAGGLSAFANTVGVKPGGVVSNALAGAEIGAVGGPVGMAAGAVVAGGVTALVHAFQNADRKRAEKAAHDFGVDVAQRTSAAVASGTSAPAARKISTGRAKLDAGRSALGDLRAAERQMQPGTMGDYGKALELRKRGEATAKAAGLDPNALLRGNSRAYRQAGLEMASGYGQSLRERSGGSTAKVLTRDFKAQFGGVDRDAQAAGVTQLTKYAAGLQQAGKLPKAELQKLLRQLKNQFPGLVDAMKQAGVDSTAALARTLRGERIVAAANKLTANVARQFPGIPNAIQHSLVGTAAVASSQMNRLRDIMANGTASQRKAATREYNQLRDQVGSALKGLRSEYGFSEREAKQFNRAVVRQAEDAIEKGVPANKAYGDAVAAQRSKLTKAKEATDNYREAVRLTSEALDQMSEKARKAPSTGVIPGGGGAAKGQPVRKQMMNRRGGRISHFQDGGLVPALVSPGELLDYGGASEIVPGARVAADTVPMMLPVGTRVFTDHGQQLLASGASPDQALAQQVPHFNKGGQVQAFAKGGFVSTAYGPPWNSMNGTGITATGIKLGAGIKRYIVAVDPSVIPLRSKVGIWPNPFGYHGKFAAEDTGGAIKGRRIDFYDWRGRESQMAWGRRKVTVGTETTSGDAKRSSASRSSVSTKTKSIAARVGKSTTRARDAFGDALRAGLQFGEDGWTRNKMRRLGGNPYLDELRDGLAEDRESWTRQRETKLYTDKPDGKTAAAATSGIPKGVSRSSHIGRMIAKASAIDRREYPYSWGGGHGTIGSPSIGTRTSKGGPRGLGYDCSGAVSAVLGAGGLLKQPLTSGALASWGVKGSGKYLQVQTDPEHVIMRLGSRWFGTSGSNPKGGAGWLSSNTMAGRGVSRTWPGLRAGGMIQRFGGGSKGVAMITGTATSAASAPTGRTGKAVGAVLASKSVKAADRALDRLDDIVGHVAASKLQDLADYLSRRVNGAGTKRSRDIAAAGLKVVGGEIGRRIGSVATKRGTELDALKAKAEQSVGGDPDSIAGRQAAIGFTSQAHDGANKLAAKLERDIEVQTAKLSKRKNLKPADMDLALKPLQDQLKAAREASKDFGESLGQMATDLARDRPKLEAAARDQQWDLADAHAALTDTTADDEAALKGRQAQQKADLATAEASGDVQWQIDILGAMKATNDALANIDESTKQAAAAKQESDEQAKTLTDLMGQMVENQQRIISGSATSRDALTAAIGAAAGGYIGQSVTRGSATPGYASGGVRL